MAVLRRTRILAAFVIACIFFFTRSYDSLPATPKWASAKLPMTRYPVDSSEVLTWETTGHDLVETTLEPNAHRLSSADAFLPHFEAVTRLPGLTLAESKSTCTWPDDLVEKINFQYGWDQDWMKNETTMEELEFRRKEWHTFVDRDMVPYSQAKHKFSGRGIVIVAGNQDTLKRLRIILRMLIKFKSKIPVEIAYWEDEMNSTTMNDLKKLYPKMYFNDLASESNIIHINKTGVYVNYQLKTAAVINSRFAEPLLMDSDNIPVIDPASLYETAEYKEYGTIFWPDIARTRPQNPIWPITNTHCRMDEYEQESGQMLVDKTRFFYHLQLATWFNNNHQDYYNRFLLGDKDMFRFAWHALKTYYGRPRKWLTSVGTLNKGFYCGHSFAQHHPNGSVAFLHGGLVKTTDLEVIKWNRDTQGGFFRHYKRSPDDQNKLQTGKVWIKWDTAEYKPTKSADFHGGHCTDMEDVEARDLDEIVPGFEKTFDEMGGYWMIDGFVEGPPKKEDPSVPAAAPPVVAAKEAAPIEGVASSENTLLSADSDSKTMPLTGQDADSAGIDTIEEEINIANDIRDTKDTSPADILDV